MRALERMRPIVLAAGGTAGHLFPAEALAAELVSRGCRVVLMTDARSASHVFEGRERFVIAGTGVAGRGLFGATKSVARLTFGVTQARGILSRLDAAAVVGFGGYPAVAPVVAASTLRPRPRVVLHEQNAVLGRANRVLARFADLLVLSVPGTTRLPQVASMVLGNPVRDSIAPTPYASGDILRLLVLGGSLGARVFSEVVPAALLALPASLRTRLHVTQQCRAEDIERTRAAYAEAGIVADLAPFFGNVPELLNGATLVVARSGASTVAELAASGRPAVLVPLPHAIDDHQTANARVLADAGAAWVAPQHTLDPQSLASLLERLLHDPALLHASAVAARTVARPNAAADLADAVERLLEPVA